MQASTRLQTWYSRQTARTHAIIVGITIGFLGGLIGLLLAVAGPVIAVGAVLGLLAGLYILTDVTAALYGLIAILILLPFGSLPFKVVFTPTLLDVSAGAFLLVYLFQWMTGRRSRLILTPIHAMIVLYGLWLLLSFALGLRHAPPTPNKLKQFAETLLAISLTFVLVDLLRDPTSLRRLILMFALIIGAEALLTIVLYVLPDDLTERILVRLARIGYPNGGVIRYIEDNPGLAERAIGTWVDPNALGGTLAVAATLISTQIFARKPILRWRWILIITLALVTIALFLTFSRASMLAFGAGLFVIGVARYRRYLPLLFLGGILLLLLPQTQIFVERFVQAFTGADLATQMRIGEYTDSLRLISRYPIFGVGFTGAPDIDIYTDVASMYLIMANQIGLVGVMLYLLLMGSVLFFGLRAWRAAKYNPELDAIHLGIHAALIALMVNGVADLYFFRLDFQASVTVMWMMIGLALTSSRLANQLLPNRSESSNMTRQSKQAV